MFLYIQSFLIVLLEIACCKLFFETFGEKKQNKGRFFDIGIVFLLTICSYALSICFNKYFMIKEVSIIVITAFLMMEIVRMSFVKSLILSALYQGLVLAVDYMILLCAVYLFHSTVDIDNSNFIKGVLIVLLAKVILFSIVLMINKKNGKIAADVLNDKDWLKFIFFPIFSVFTIIAMIVNLGDISNQKAKDIFFVIAFGMVGLNFVIFYLISDILKRESKIRESEILQIQVKNQTSMYQSISENYEEQRRRTHEYKNQLLCMDSLLADGKYDELKTYLDKICGKLDRNVDSINTNHVIINAILNTKYKEALENHILFILKINDLSDIKIEDEDIVLILSNLLNNAIEACKNCKENKVIKMKFVKEDEITVISVKNTYEGDVNVHEGTYITSKEDKEKHGIGINNIIETINKYQGEYIIKNDNNEFYFSILIPR